MTKAITLTPLQDVEGVPTAVLQLIEITAIDFFKGDENAPKTCKPPQDKGGKTKVRYEPRTIPR